MCPLCEKCSTWPLHQICGYTKISYLFDHPGTVFYAVFMSFWGKDFQAGKEELVHLMIFLTAVTFLEYWKRKNASLVHHWDCMGFQEEDERPRPQFAANAPYLEKNPITGIREPSFPAAVRMRRIAAGSGIILVMVKFICVFFYIYSCFFRYLWFWSLFWQSSYIEHWLVSGSSPTPQPAELLLFWQACQGQWYGSLLKLYDFHHKIFFID